VIIVNTVGGNWSIFKRNRRQVLRFLVGEYNRAYHEAVFEEDFKRAEEYKKSVDFIKSMDYDKYNEKQICPICGSDKYMYGQVNDVLFFGFNDKELGKFENLTILKCQDCGFYSIHDW